MEGGGVVEAGAEGGGAVEQEIWREMKGGGGGELMEGRRKSRK